MGRELKRVEAGFDWPLGTIWKGYVCPHKYTRCASCEGRGRGQSYRAFESVVSLLLIAGADSRRAGVHPYFDSTPIDAVGTNLHQITEGLAGRTMSPFGHDACDRWTATEKIAVAAGVDLNSFDLCPACSGSCIRPGHEEESRLAEEWDDRTEPPDGEWYQIWETVSEGSPITPAFETPEEVARWISTPGNCTWMGAGKGYDMWLAFIRGPGWAPSAMSIDGGEVMGGVEAVVALAESP